MKTVFLSVLLVALVGCGKDETKTPSEEVVGKLPPEVLNPDVCPANTVFNPESQLCEEIDDEL